MELTADTIRLLLQGGSLATLVALLLLAVLKILPTIRAQSLESKQQDLEGWRAECTDLRNRLETCERLCRERDESHTTTVNKLHEEIFGIRKQHLTEQISMINVILNSVDAPELRQLLKTLESVKAALRLEQMVQISGPSQQEEQQQS